MTKLSTRLQVLGAAQRHPGVLSEIARVVAEAAAAKTIQPDDALEVYVAYFKASSLIKNIDPYLPSVRVNVSKLRQIIKAADPELLRRVTKERDKLALQGKDVLPLYHAMVAVCRAQNRTMRKLTLDVIAKTIRR